MPRIAKLLSALEVNQLSEPGYHSVGGVAGLTLQITPNGARSWILRAAVADRRREIGLGSYPGVSLARARRKAQDLRDQIVNGIEPVMERKEAREALRRKQAAA